MITLLIAAGALLMALLGIGALCACLSGCCCADRAALLGAQRPARPSFTSSVPSVKVS